MQIEWHLKSFLYDQELFVNLFIAAVIYCVKKGFPPAVGLGSKQVGWVLLVQQGIQTIPDNSTADNKNFR